MLVKTPMQEKKQKQTKTNRRPAAKNKRPGTGFNGNGGADVVYGKKSKKESSFSLPSVAAWKLIVGAIVIGALGVLYLNHVFATQQLLSEVQQMENEYQKAKSRHEDYRLTYDRMIGPKEIYEKAKEQGFINGGPADNIIIVEED